MFGVPIFIVCTILKNKEAIQAADVAEGVTTLTSRGSKSMEQIEKFLCILINEKQLTGDVISEIIICEKAKVLHDELVKGMPDTSAQKQEFNPLPPNGY